MHCFSDENVFAKKWKTELCLQVYLPSSKYEFQLDITCLEIKGAIRRLGNGPPTEVLGSRESIIEIHDRKIKNAS